MLSLLSLLVASGTVLRADTEEWTPLTYPDPRTNYTECNTWSNSTLCDPDHILTDQWRLQIHQNLNSLMEKLKMVNVEYTENAPFQCYDNPTSSLQLYVILAKRIQSAKNHTITELDLTKFGDGLVEQFGLKSLPCKNFLIFIGVEGAKIAYVRTGSDLKLPSDLMEHIFNKYNLFKAKNFMEVLSKIVTEIGERITESLDMAISAGNDTSPFVEDELLNMLSNITIEIPDNFTSMPQSSVTVPSLTPVWVYPLLTITTSLSTLSLILLLFSRRHNKKLKNINSMIATGTSMRSLQHRKGHKLFFKNPVSHNHNDNVSKKDPLFTI
ncbi:unnamed protein product [Bursaphelenchus okinawaensis]|uniref:TPM domain-containing protein n=1 Tax=Bursaphelenchus okinawaensis TaxID=465554 RepID=A0A811KL10_9BILA|nr:unnamed protein product [Bursaphelenchus okinawaensis]CAG9104748.1 unnamed protein product [Bursaphelenchus okinawaensis]